MNGRIPLLVVVLGGTGCLGSWVYERLRPGPMPPAQVPDGLASVSAESCGACHQAIYEEWRGSRMGQAFTDPVFQHDWSEQNELYYCLNCHAPLENQQPNLVTGLSSVQPLTPIQEPNPDFDAELQAEGVTCVVCHLRDGVLVGPHEVGSAPHPVVRDDQLASAGSCERCHQMEELPLTRTERPLADTHREWQAWREQTGRTEDCVACHMPAIERPVVSGGESRSGRQHTFVGAWDDALVRSSVSLESVRREGDTVVVELENQAGHRVPTAEPARGLQVEAALLDGEGEPLPGQQSRRDAWLARRVDLPVVRERSDTTLLPGETRSVRLDFGEGGLTPAAGARVRVLFHRLEFSPHAQVLLSEEFTSTRLPGTPSVQLAEQVLEWSTRGDFE